MAYKVNDTTVIDDTGNITSIAGLTLNNDSGVISVADTSPMVGTVAGYTSAGSSGPLLISNKNEKFPFATDTNSTDVGDLINTIAFGSSTGQSSSIHGYVAGGYLGPGSNTNTIQKFPFASNANAVDVGNLTRAGQRYAGTSSPTHGYAAGGFSLLNTIDRFPFTTDSNATDVGDLTRVTQDNVGNSSTTHGYSSGGYGATPPFGAVNGIDKYAFAATANASDIADLAQAVNKAAGQSSTSHGYSSGGAFPPPPAWVNLNTIQKFPFASDTNATDIGDLSQARGFAAGQSSLQSGYTSGGYIINPPTPVIYNTIDKFPFSTDSNATDVGDLVNGITRGVTGNQD